MLGQAQSEGIKSFPNRDGAGPGVSPGPLQGALSPGPREQGQDRALAWHPPISFLLFLFSKPHFAPLLGRQLLSTLCGRSDDADATASWARLPIYNVPGHD